MIAPFIMTRQGVACVAVRNFNTVLMPKKLFFACIIVDALRAPTCLHPSVVCTWQSILAKQIEVR